MQVRAKRFVVILNIRKGVTGLAPPPPICASTAEVTDDQTGMPCFDMQALLGGFRPKYKSTEAWHSPSVPVRPAHRTSSHILHHKKLGSEQQPSDRVSGSTCASQLLGGT